MNLLVYKLVSTETRKNIFRNLGKVVELGICLEFLECHWNVRTELRGQPGMEADGHVI